MDKFKVKIKVLTDGSIYAEVHGNRPVVSKKLGAFSGSIDQVMAKAARTIKAELDEMNEKALQQIEE